MKRRVGQMGAHLDVRYCLLEATNTAGVPQIERLQLGLRRAHLPLTCKLRLSIRSLSDLFAFSCDIIKSLFGKDVPKAVLPE